MGITSFTQEFTCPIAPSRMYKALILESNQLIPKLLPKFIKSVEVIQGDGGAGSIEQVNFTEATGVCGCGWWADSGVGVCGSVGVGFGSVGGGVASHFKYVKHRLDELDKDNFVCKYTMIEGDALGDKLESIAYEVKFEAASDGGCICKMISKYNTIGDFEIKEEEIKAGKDSAIGIYKVVEAYLLENPQVYA
uniref:Bet v I/Major latex protein domain-containing protein n=1 Tax=Quercus lobata TaxID=97700 RepID=A0A7N2LV39_QUELO